MWCIGLGRRSKVKGTRSENVISRLLLEGNSVYYGITLDIQIKFSRQFLTLLCGVSVCQSIMAKGLLGKRNVHEGYSGGTSSSGVFIQE